MDSKYNGCDNEEKRYPAFSKKDKIIFTLLAIAALGFGLYECLTLHG